MSTFRNLSRVVGTISPWVAALLAPAVDELASELLVNALARWRDGGFVRFDNGENNCTIQVYRCALEVRDTTAALRILQVHLEWVQPTTEMMAGTQSADHMRRPDLRVEVGSTAGWTVECKRLGTASLSREYVAAGMGRFTSAAYSPKADSAGMIGFVQSGNVAQIVESLNRAIRAHQSLTTSDQLAPEVSSEGRIELFHSLHQRVGAQQIRLVHYLVDMR